MSKGSTEIDGAPQSDAAARGDQVNSGLAPDTLSMETLPVGSERLLVRLITSFEALERGHLGRDIEVAAVCDDLPCPTNRPVRGIRRRPLLRHRGTPSGCPWIALTLPAGGGMGPCLQEWVPTQISLGGAAAYWAASTILGFGMA